MIADDRYSLLHPRAHPVWEYFLSLPVKRAFDAIKLKFFSYKLSHLACLKETVTNVSPRHAVPYCGLLDLASLRWTPQDTASHPCLVWPVSPCHHALKSPLAVAMSHGFASPTSSHHLGLDSSISLFTIARWSALELTQSSPAPTCKGSRRTAPVTTGTLFTMFLVLIFPFSVHRKYI